MAAISTWLWKPTRPGLNKLTRFDRQRTNAARVGGKMITKILSSNKYSAGLTSAELFDLVHQREPPTRFWKYTPPSLKYVPPSKKNPAPEPPHPEHPVRSLSFLKSNVLPMLEAKKAISRVSATRRTVHDTSEKTWVWKQIDQRTLPSRRPAPPKTVFGKEVGVGEDWGHLSKRRRRARYGKVRRDVEVMKEIRSKVQEKKQAADLATRMVAKKKKEKLKLALEAQKQTRLEALAKRSAAAAAINSTVAVDSPITLEAH
ncbi:hypothetical protein C8J56DRAFT_1040836 [Mycena floridula]|nr:hypothetical protein C8J56DRAFT_1040836 [Mycena floridula]